ncbi:MAG: cell division protein ZapA [Bacteroidota bacterium]
MAAAKQDTVNITVIIAARPYPLRVGKKDEAMIRKIVKEVNEKVNKFQLTYTTKDRQDCLAMALLSYAVDLQKNKEQSSDNSLLSAQLTHLEKLIDQALSE